jgi:hypothetical protein
MTNTNENQLHALRVKLNAMREDLYNMVFSEVDQAVAVAQQAKVRSLKSKITRLENAR